MKLIITFLLASACATLSVTAQDYYTTSCFELLFQKAIVTKDGASPDQNLRLSTWFNYTQQAHLNFNNILGVYSGLSVRNIGFTTTNENIATKQNAEVLVDKIKRRVYMVGIPLALKCGAFDKHFYLYGGGEAAIVLAYKEKRFIKDSKTKKTSFLGKQTKIFQPSVFAGVQFHHDLNIQYRLFLYNLLDNNYGKGTEYDQSGFSKSILQCISVCYNFKHSDTKIKTHKTSGKPDTL